ncbi:hypothetical protein [Mycolicibacterium mucogenicum]|nr:hypothetical protein [Mycolicibacterium mucogenicum]
MTERNWVAAEPPNYRRPVAFGDVYDAVTRYGFAAGEPVRSAGRTAAD